MTQLRMDEKHWKRKLMAFLHDPPCKALDLGRHEDQAWSFCLSAGMTEEDKPIFKGIKSSDHTASAIDRFPFPKGKCSAKFTGLKNETFKHPFCGAEYVVDDIKNVGAYVEILQNAFGGIKGDWREKFFLYWRLWLENSVSIQNVHGGHLAVFPADTRLPDHTIWNHLSVTSALEGCRANNKEIEPALLLFQAGPVQDFIAQARSTRDLWSGSYILSWLMGNAMKAITDEVGPDSIMFPSLRGIGVFDAANKDIYDNVSYKGIDGEDTLWRRLYGSVDGKGTSNAEILLNPSLPNRFLAIVPVSLGRELAIKAENAFKNEFRDIASRCWERFQAFVQKIDRDFDASAYEDRWRGQIENFPEITWNVTPVEKDIEKIRAKAKELPRGRNGENASDVLDSILELATNAIDENDRDERYYELGDKSKLSNWGVAWAVNYSICAYELSARRNTRDFHQFITDDNQAGSPKDSLSGKEEIIGSKSLWEKIKCSENEFFKENEGPYGAISIVKRFWCRGENNYLFKKLDIDEKVFKQVIAADSVEDIAKRNANSKNPYVAVIALDGDSMGEWMSGTKARPFTKQLAGKATEYFSAFKVAEPLKRPLTPSYHLQFSEALSNFANHLVGKIVDEYRGQLIYAGGDDVLAMVPATRVIQCAQMLRTAFRGDKDYIDKISSYNKMNLAILQDGFANSGMDFPLIVPGTEADVSCGISIAHYRYPLQKMIEEARNAEQKAKNEYDRSSFAISLLKRGGEIVHWGGKWNSSALELLAKFNELTQGDNSPVSGRFPYALSELLAPYGFSKNIDSFEANKTFDDSAKKIIIKELEHVLEQQVSTKDARDALEKLCLSYLEDLSKERVPGREPRWDDFANLFLTASFIERDRGE